VATGTTLESVTAFAGYARAVDRRRQAHGVAVAVAGLPLLTLVLTTLRGDLSLADELLLYLIAVVAIAVIGGLWPALAAAIASSLLLNWFFTPPIHTFVASPDNVLSLVLFVAVATLVAAVVHIAARRAVEAEEGRAQAAQAEMLAAGNRMRTALLAAVSHDLRTPLAGIKASITGLRQTDVAWSATDRAELLETIEDSADRLGALIANLLDMSRVQTGALQPFLQPAAVDEIVPVALRGIPGADTVRLDTPEDLPLVRTDPGLLERALANLLSNALRHSPPGRPPTLVARHEGDRLALRVVDHGPGVAVGDRDRIFEPFQRLGDRSVGGVGLGLAVARGFVEAIGGELAAGDSPGGGLTMTVQLPLAPATVPAEQVAVP
jgi:two-component system sensor histidine kinase KdpD